MSAQIIKRLVEKMDHVVFSPGDFAIEEGDLGTDMFFLSTGSATVIVRKVQVAVLNAGDCFGEIALLVPNVMRTASVVALAFCEAHSLNHDDFHYCMKDFPLMRDRLKKIADERLSELKQNELVTPPTPGVPVGGTPDKKRRSSWSSLVPTATKETRRFSFSAAEGVQATSAFAALAEQKESCTNLDLGC